MWRWITARLRRRRSGQRSVHSPHRLTSVIVTEVYYGIELTLYVGLQSKIKSLKKTYTLHR